MCEQHDATPRLCGYESTLVISKSNYGASVTGTDCASDVRCTNIRTELPVLIAYLAGSVAHGFVAGEFLAHCTATGISIAPVISPVL